MKRLTLVLSAAALSSLTLSSYGQLVNDTWLDGTRTDPATYSEMGVDGDLDGNIESRWFGSTLTPSTGHLVGAVGATSSSSWTTYFTDTAANAVNLANVGDSMTVTWVFTPTGVTAQNSSQGFHLGLVQSPAAGRLAADGTPANQVYAGYGIFMNMGTTLGRANGDNFDIMEWAVPGGANNFLSTSAAWSKIGAGDGALAGTGFVDGTQYTLTIQLQHVATGLQLDASLAGGSINGTGLMSASFLDTTVSSYIFDTYGMRPTAGSVAATSFDFTQFQVQVSQVPEPAVTGMLGVGLLGAIWSYRRNRK